MKFQFQFHKNIHCKQLKEKSSFTIINYLSIHFINSQKLFKLMLLQNTNQSKC